MLGYGSQVLGFWVRFHLAVIQCRRIDNGAGPADRLHRTIVRRGDHRDLFGGVSQDALDGYAPLVRLDRFHKEGIDACFVGCISTDRQPQLDHPARILYKRSLLLEVPKAWPMLN
jgi:hypothetical protein